MKFESMRVKLTFIDELLGSASSDPEVHKTFIASKAPDAPSKEEEIAALGVDEVTQKGMTVFSRDEEGNPILWGYQIRGFFKAACAACAKMNDSISVNIKAYKKMVDREIFVVPHKEDMAGRKLKINISGEMGNCQRPLRAQTMQGERIALADSETIPAGSTIEFDIVSIESGLHDLVKEWLDYGAFNGLGQWRNSGKGAFTYEILDDQMTTKSLKKKKTKKEESTEE